MPDPMSKKRLEKIASASKDLASLGGPVFCAYVVDELIAEVRRCWEREVEDDRESAGPRSDSGLRCRRRIEMTEPMSEETLEYHEKTVRFVEDLEAELGSESGLQMARELCAEVRRLKKELADLRVLYRRQTQAHENQNKKSGKHLDILPIL